MKELRQYITWREEPNPGKPKPKKVPFDHRTGKRTDPTDSATWMSHAEAVATGKMIGFVFTAADPYFFLDLDGCRDGDGWTAAATAAVAMFPGAEVEVSHNGCGLHVFGKYTGARPVHGCKSGGWMELYTADRFAAIGSAQLGDATTDCTDALHRLVVSHFPPVVKGTSAGWTTEPVEAWTGTDDDAELLRKALKTKSNSVLFGHTASFESLWTANEAQLSVFFPDPDRPFDHNRADLALAGHLGYWTGNNCERIRLLMWQSALARDKWSERGDWLEQTVLMGAAGTKVYDYVAPAKEEATAQQVYQFMAAQDQVAFFKGCIYVIGLDRVMTPDGQLLSKNQFNSAVQSYEFARDTTGTKTTRSPWEAFNQSLSIQQPQAIETCFDPLQPWDEPIARGGSTYANTYRPIDTPRKAGDPSPFLTHVARMLPDPGDYAILIAYMAAVVQHKGVKFHWAPVLQGVEGNGKSMIAYVLHRVLGSHFARASGTDLGNKFFGWIISKLLIGIEDVRISEFAFDTLKPLITNSNIAVQPKGLDQRTIDTCANFLFSTNHRDGIPKSRNDRRFAVFFTAQQERADLIGEMSPENISAVYDWLDKEGYAIVHEFLATYAIPDELNPATSCRRAPDTSTIDEVISSSLNATDQEVLDWIEEGRPGFKRPWVSRTMLRRALHEQNNKLTPNRQRETLQRLGYVPHPALPAADGRMIGRTNNDVRPDGCKAELWVLKDHPAAAYATNSRASHHYETTQGLSSEEQHDDEYQQRT